MSAVADRYEEFQELGVDIIAVSVDSMFVHKVWDESELAKMVDGGIPFPMVADGAGNLGRVYGVYDENAGVDIRGRFIIDPDGVIQAAEILTPPVGRNVEETIRQVKAFQHVRASVNGSPLSSIRTLIRAVGFSIAETEQNFPSDSSTARRNFAGLRPSPHAR